MHRPAREAHDAGALAVAAARHVPHAGRVGPNAVIQLRVAFAGRYGAGDAARLMRRVGLSHYVDKDPSSLIAEAEAMRLFTGVRAALSQAEADALLGVAGVATGRYILAHRIPAPARALLKCLPAPLAAPLLMKAIAAHAWTFAGSGKVVTRTRPRLTIEIEANPLATPGCPWHLGVLETLFRALVSPTARVRHDACCAEGQRSCRSSISL